MVPPLIPADFRQHCRTLDLGLWDGLAWGCVLPPLSNQTVLRTLLRIATVSSKQNEDFPRAVPLSSDGWSPKAWVVCPRLSGWAWGLPREELCFPQTQASSDGVGHPVVHMRTGCCCFCPVSTLGALQSCDVTAISLSHSFYLHPRPKQAWTSFAPPAQQPLPFPQICKGASADERLQWHLPEGAAFSWLPNPDRTLEGRGSLTQHPSPLLTACLPYSPCPC